MSKELYAIVAGAMRYVFVLLGVLIVLRAFLMLRRDRRQTDRTLRRLPDAGFIGEFEVLRASGELEEGSVLPVPTEGTLGLYRSCDLTLPCEGVHKRHLDFILDERLGLLILPRSGCTVTVDGAECTARSKPEAHPMLHGSTLEVGDALLRLRLFAGVSPQSGAAFVPDPATDTTAPWHATDTTAPWHATDTPDPFRSSAEAISDLVDTTSTPNAPWLPLRGSCQRNALTERDSVSVSSPRRTRHTDRGERDWSE